MFPDHFNFADTSTHDALRPIGDSDFAQLVCGYRADPTIPFIDKTKMIETIFAHNESVTLFTRPRRFGKSTNLSMMHYFLAVPEARSLFKSLAIGQNHTLMEKHQGAYSVINISLKDLSATTYLAWIKAFKLMMWELFLPFEEILTEYLEKPKNRTKKEFFNKIINKQGDETDLKISLFELSQYLKEAFNKPVWILIDEYDAPLHEAYTYKYYPEMIQFMRSFFGKVLKDNPNLGGGVITGILRVAKESLFSSLNNVEVDSIFNYDYAPYFGFTPEEVQLLLFRHGFIPSSTDSIPSEVVQWYNGYKVGDVTLYNPWSIIKYLTHKELKPYWVNTGSDLLLKECLDNPNYEFPEKLKQLLLGETIHEIVSENLEMSTLENDEAGLWSLLVASGYLKIICPKFDFNEPQELAIPNFEVRSSLKQVGKYIFHSNTMGVQWFYKALEKLLQEGKTEAFFEGLEKILKENASFHDLGVRGENFYHGLLLGIIATLQSSHRVLSNRESGHGRYDLAVIPEPHYQNNKGKRRALIFEIKRIPWPEEQTEKEMKQHLKETAHQALQQVEERDYLSEFRQTHAQEVIAIGIAFSGKLFYGQAQVYDLS